MLGLLKVGPVQFLPLLQLLLLCLVRRLLMHLLDVEQLLRMMFLQLLHFLLVDILQRAGVHVDARGLLQLPCLMFPEFL